MNYNMPTGNGFNNVSSGLFPFDVDKKLFQEWFPLTLFAQFTGEDQEMPVALKKLQDGAGLAYSVPRLEALDYANPIKDRQQRSGMGVKPKVVSDTVMCEALSWVVDLPDLDLMKLGTPVDLPAQVYNMLKNTQQRHLSRAHLAAATIDTYNLTLNGSMPVEGRAVVGSNGADGTGTAYSPVTNALLAARIHALAGANGGNLTNQKLTFIHLQQLLETAVQNPQHAIRPGKYFKKMGGEGFEYFYFADPKAINQLMLDDNFQKLFTARGTIVSDEQPNSVNGAEYLGKALGIHIYSCPELAQFRLTSTGTYAWNLFFGAGAWSIAWPKYPRIVRQDNLIDNRSEYASHEIRGLKALSFNAKTLIANAVHTKAEQGIIHSFTKLA